MFERNNLLIERSELLSEINHAQKKGNNANTKKVLEICADYLLLLVGTPDKGLISANSQEILSAFITTSVIPHYHPEYKQGFFKSTTTHLIDRTLEAKPIYIDNGTELSAEGYLTPRVRRF